MKQERSAGFTIIELMIATVVFSIVLLVIAGAIVQIGRLYYKGITASRTQSVTRSTIDSITQAIQFNAGDIVATNNADGSAVTALVNPSDVNSRAVCIGNNYFMFRLGQQREGSLHALTSQSTGSSCTAKVADDMRSHASGTELLGDHMRLSNLVVQPLQADGQSYKVLLRVVYGDDDLLCTDSGSIPCTGSDTLTDIQRAQAINNARDLRCKDIRTGGQFCAESELSTIVERRL